MNDIRTFLAEETCALHRAVDARAARFDLATKVGFAGFLSFMWRGCAAVETALTHAGAAAVLAEWPQRTRARELAADLASPPAPQFPSVSFHNEAEIWGALYVLEGSRLGARLLATKTPLAEQSAFFLTSVNCRFWPVFVDRLRTADRRLASRAAMANGAHLAFGAFLDKPAACWPAEHGTLTPALQ